MRSYAVVDRIEGHFAVCEVELIPAQESRPEDFATKPTEMMEFDLEQISEEVGEVQECDVLEVEHDENQIICILCKNMEEKSRRI